MNQDLFDEIMVENSHLLDENKKLLQRIQVFNSKLLISKATFFEEVSGDCPNCGCALKVEFADK